MIFLADFPPPVHGMSNINAAIYKELKLKSKKNELMLIDTSPPIPEKYFNTYVWLVAKTLLMPVLLIRITLNRIFFGHSVMYRAINGGSGQIFDIMFIALARVLRVTIFIHHHSFNYVSNKNVLFYIVAKVAGNEAIHIVLGDQMKDGLIRKYKIPNQSFRVQSNLAFFQEAMTHSIKKEDKPAVIRIGLLSNLCEDKGLGVFIDVCSELKDAGVLFEACLGGPFVDKTSEQLFINSDCEIDYLGPVYGGDKDSFYKSIDVFIFPSKYFNEAEPLVLYEAAQNGLYLIGTNRGCMADVINTLHGFVVSEDQFLVSKIVEKIKVLTNSDQLFGKKLETRKEKFNEKIQNDKLSLRELLNEMLSKN